MLHIDRLRMQLPAGFEHRAATIARLLGGSLATYHPRESRSLDRLSISPVQVSAQATDREIADCIAKRITVVLGRGA